MSNREQKQAVLSKVNQVLRLAGLNDTVWSIRDCDSPLFVLLYKKITDEKVGHLPHAHASALAVGVCERGARERAFLHSS